MSQSKRKVQAISPATAELLAEVVKGPSAGRLSYKLTPAQIRDLPSAWNLRIRVAIALCKSEIHDYFTEYGITRDRPEYDVETWDPMAPLVFEQGGADCLRPGPAGRLVRTLLQRLGVDPNERASSAIHRIVDAFEKMEALQGLAEVKRRETSPLFFVLSHLTRNGKDPFISRDDMLARLDGFCFDEHDVPEEWQHLDRLTCPKPRRNQPQRVVLKARRKREPLASWKADHVESEARSNGFWLSKSREAGGA